jgi:hypothetical protein
MDEIFKIFGEWLLRTYPVMLYTIGGIIVFLYIIKEFKVTFIDKGGEKTSLGYKIKHFFLFWLKAEQKTLMTEEKKHIVLSDEERKKLITRLENHNFFQQVNLIKNNVIPSMNFGDIRKNQVLKDVIKIYVESIEEGSLFIIRNYKLDLLSNNELNEILSKEIEKISTNIYSKLRNRLGDILYNKIIEDPVKGFKAKNSIFREIFVSGVLYMSVQHMSVYNYNNYERATEIFTSMYISLQTIVKNFEQVFKEFNGELNKYL